VPDVGGETSAAPPRSPPQDPVARRGGRHRAPGRRARASTH